MERTMRFTVLTVVTTLCLWTAASALAQPVAEKSENLECALGLKYYESFVKDALGAVREKRTYAARVMLDSAEAFFKKSCLTKRSDEHVDAARGHVRLLMDTRVADAKRAMDIGDAHTALNHIQRVQELYWQTEIEPPAGMMDEIFRGIDSGVLSGKITFENAAVAERRACRIVSSPPFTPIAGRFEPTTPYTPPDRCKKYPKER
ncbi:MAG: hypothetical protein A3H76_01365 [Candidatus Lloydbacteria bacterium RIFCSPLOWO2_02_FULL_54_12]|nr:MAG: hypothetical protein A3H76_01365 [Candidatus Lloydbacteria bacterium RIFCSPLOWO2_02_FULL_54_12]